jgi:hypothetical protein
MLDMDLKGYMRALDDATSEILWSFPSSGSVASGPAIADGMVFWGSGYGEHTNSPTVHNAVTNNVLYAFAPSPMWQNPEEMMMAISGKGWLGVSLLGTPSFAVLATIVGITAGASATRADALAQKPACQGDNGGLTLSPGFCATIFADNLGHVRHLVVAPDGTLYANTWSGRYFPNAPPPPGGFLLALKDTRGEGRADVQRFGVTVEAGGTGGSGIALYHDALFAEENGRILRYTLAPGTALLIGQPTVVLSGLPLTGDHPMHPFVIDSKGELFVDLGSATNSCQFQNRIPNSPGHNPCTEEETRAGTWRYDANKTGQVFSPKERFVTGLRNGEGFAFDDAGRLFATQHGRDQLFQNWPRFYTAAQSAELPAEEWSNSFPAPTMAGRSAITTSTRISWCSRLNMAAMAARRWVSARSDRRRSPPSQDTGPPTIWLSITGRASRRPIAAAPSSRSTDRGTARLTRRAAITSSSSRLPMARPLGRLWFSRTASPGRTKIRAERRSVQPA